jgi:hypothetical protein
MIDDFLDCLRAAHCDQSENQSLSRKGSATSSEKYNPSTLTGTIRRLRRQALYIYILQNKTCPKPYG